MVTVCGFPAAKSCPMEPPCELHELRRRVRTALAFAELWTTRSEVTLGMERILRGEPDGIADPAILSAAVAARVLEVTQ